MKKIYLILAAAVGMTITSCTSSDYLGDMDPNAQAAINDGAIHFGTAAKGMTRADFTGAEAAQKLNGKFVVTGFKGSETTTPGKATSGINGGIVFDNYLVVYGENTANTTESNSSNWEYVGVTPIKHATDNGISLQTIKYWDYSQAQYDFIAWGMGKVGDNEITPIYDDAALSGHQVRVSAIRPNSKDKSWGSASGLDQVSYTFEGNAEDLAQCYISDLVTVKKSSTTAGNRYGDAVTLKFRQLGSKVRIAIYETVPGYSVKNVQFYTAANVDLADGTKNNAHLFTTVENNIYKGGTYTVYFPHVDQTSSDSYYADNNQAHIKFSGDGYTQDTKVNWGGMNYTIRERGEKDGGAVYLGRSSNTASFAGTSANNYYDFFLPNEAGTNLNLRVNYTLEAIDGSGETIEVKGATAQVPSIYTTWKPGYAYTYLFKISDKTNGHTGDYNPLYPDDVTVNSDPAGLYPITFDALVVNAEDNDATQSNSQETITTVSAPSITTYQKGSTVVNKNEYDHATGPIFVTVNDGGGYVAVTSLEVGNSVQGYYKYKDGQITKCRDDETAVEGVTYYELKDVLPNSELVTLTASGDHMAALYTLPSGNYTEADVVDAMQMQDDNAATNTVKGRSGLVLTEASFNLVPSIEYGVDGNTINLTGLPKQDGTSGTYNANAMKFTATGAGTYAFVYTKKASTTDEVKYQALDWSSFATGQTKYRYKYKKATHSYYDNNGTNDDDTDDTEYFDAQKGVKYFALDAGVYTMQTPFIGQGVSNLYLDNEGNTIAKGYAVTGTTYYYTTNNGMNYTAAHNVNYADFKEATDLYTLDGTTYTLKTDESPGDGTAYYYHDTVNDKYIYCVILPQQTKDWYELDTTDYEEATETTKVDGQTYFDKYIVNDGVYYTKVIKVQ